MKVIFLDVDGVLNSLSTSERSPEGWTGVDDVNLCQLARIVRKTGAVIVLSSTWKDMWHPDAPEKNAPDFTYLLQKLRKYDLALLDKTPGESSAYRGREIIDWIATNKKEIESFVVLDDIWFFDFNSKMLSGRIVRTSFAGGGLTERRANEAIAVLNGKE